MKKQILFISLLLAGAVTTGCASTLTVVESPETEPTETITLEELVNNNNETEMVESVVIAERTHEEAIAAKEAAEEAARKAAEEEAARKAAEEAAKKAAEEAERIAAEEAALNASRAENTTVRGISVYVTKDVSYNDYNTFIEWVNNMPSFLLNHVNSINVVSDIQNYTFTGGDASGVTKGGHDIYIKAQGLKKRLGTLYHEAGHCLDFYGGYSNSSTWQAICNAEWAGEGHYAASNESFAEAISRYYVDGLSKPQSKDAISNLINTGSLGSGDGFNDDSRSLNAETKQIWIYDGPNDFYGTVIGKVDIGNSIQSTGINGDGTWYKVNYNGQTGYVKAEMVG